MYIEYNVTQNIENNTSVITHALKLKQLTDGYDFNGNMNVTYYVAGEAFKFNGNINIDDKGNTGYTITIKSGSTTVSHNSDGSKSITFSCNGACNSGGYGPGNISLNSTIVQLNAIPRSSTISNINNVELGTSCNITWTPATSDYYYKIRFALGNWSYVTNPIHPGSTSAYTYSAYTIPVSVANQIPNSTTGIMTAYLSTYSDNACTIQIGVETSESFTVSVPDSVIPTINSFTLSLNNSKSSVVAGWNIAVSGYTKVVVSATASGAYGSTIKSFTIYGGYSITQNGSSLSYTGDILSFPTDGNKSFSVVATDSRGRQSLVSSSAVYFYAYSKPNITSFVASRLSSDDTKVSVTASWTSSSIGGRNSASGYFYYKPKSSTPTPWRTYGEIDNNNEEIISNFNTSSSYDIQLVVIDLLESTTSDSFVTTGTVLIDLRAGGKGLGIGKIAESDNLEVALDTIFIGDVYLRVGNQTISLENYIRSIINS